MAHAHTYIQYLYGTIDYRNVETHLLQLCPRLFSCRWIHNWRAHKRCKGNYPYSSSTGQVAGEWDIQDGKYVRGGGGLEKGSRNYITEARLQSCASKDYQERGNLGGQLMVGGVHRWLLCWRDNPVEAEPRGSSQYTTTRFTWGGD